MLRTIARTLLATPFILAGIDAVTAPETHRERIQKLSQICPETAKLLPQAEKLDLMTRSMGVSMTLAGAALACAKFPRLSCAALTALQIPVALANNPFWDSTGAQKRKNLLGFAGALGLLGGAIFVTLPAPDKTQCGHAQRLDKRDQDLPAPAQDSHEHSQPKHSQKQDPQTQAQIGK